MQPLYPRLRASKNVPRERVRADQHRRLVGAMVEAVWRHGYERTTVDELVALAGVSTRALYDVFGGKLACFEATCELIVARETGTIAAACSEASGPLSGDERMQLALEAFVTEIVEEPRATRLALVESLAIGPPVRALVDRGEAAFERLLLEGLSLAAEERELPRSLARAALHGLWSFARRTLLEGREQQLHGAGLSLLRWLLALRPSAKEADRLLELTSSSRSRLSARSHGERESLRPAGVEGERVRVLGACARVAASEGHAALTWTRIARESAIRPERLRELFQSPEECFGAAVEMLSARALARAMRQAAGAEDWGQSVCLALDSFYCDAARDPVFARLCFVEVLSPGGGWVQRRGALLTSFARVLVARAPRAHAPDSRTAELIAGAIWGVAHREVLLGNARSLPSLTATAAYVTLAPILGARAALDGVSAWLQANARPKS